MCAEVPAPSADALAKGHERLIAEVAASKAGSTRAGRGIRWKRRPFMGGLIVVGTAAAVTAAVAILPGATSTRTERLRPVSAVEVLGRAAKTARTEELHARNDQFIKVTSVEIADHRYTRQTWLSVDGSEVGLLRTNPCQFRSGTATCDVRLQNGDRPKGAPPMPFNGTPAYLRTLPTDPAALKAYIRAHTDKLPASKRPAEGYETWSFVVDHVVENYVPPKLRGALFDVAATVPGISVSKNVRDAIGRPGIAVRMKTGAGWQELIFDPVSYRYLGERGSTTPSGPANYQNALVKTEVASTLPPHRFLPERRHN
ncbi:CU044_5270 family protein [Actinoallomurus iriomotensis]|nr:CU044_5270 family protein [Actinoallomurus iriomotensis]